MEYDYTPRGVCSRNIHVEVEDGIVKNVIFTGGCSGNTQGVAALAKGMKVDEVIELIKSEAKQRVEKMPTMNSLALPEVSLATMIDVVVGGATIFVIDVDQFKKF